MKFDKETIKFLPILDHQPQFPISSQFSPLTHDLSELSSVKSPRFNDLMFQRFNHIFTSPTQSNQIQPNPTTPPPPGKEVGKEMINFLTSFNHPQRCAVSSPFSR